MLSINHHGIKISKFGLWRPLEFLLVVGLIGALAPSTTLAQSIPAGSYQRSCSDTRVMGTTLIASCSNKQQQRKSTNLPLFQQCIGDIRNENGQLMCDFPLGTNVPTGSYRRTCRGIIVAGETLHASCINRAGDLLATTLDGISQCSSDISNNNGRLACQMASTQGATLTGTYVYDNPGTAEGNQTVVFRGHIESGAGQAGSSEFSESQAVTVSPGTRTVSVTFAARGLRSGLWTVSASPVGGPGPKTCQHVRVPGIVTLSVADSVPGCR